MGFIVKSPGGNVSLGGYNPPKPEPLPPLVVENQDAGATWESVQARKEVEARNQAAREEYSKKQMEYFYNFNRAAERDLPGLIAKIDDPTSDLDDFTRTQYKSMIQSHAMYGPVYKQAQQAKKAEAEAAAKQQEVEAQRIQAERYEQQQRTKQTLQTEEETGGPATVVRGTQTTGLGDEGGGSEGSRRRRRGRQLSTYLGI